MEGKDPTISPTVHVSFGLLISAFVAALILSFILNADITARGTGRIVPMTRVQQIQPDSPGRITAIHVRNGDLVTKGNVLIEFDPTQAAAELSKLTRELSHLSVEKRRLQVLGAFISALSVSDDTAIKPFTNTFDTIPISSDEQSYLKEQRNLLIAEMAELRDKIAQQASKREENLKAQAVTKANIEQLEASLPIREQRLKTSEQLKEQGAASGTAYLNYLEEFVTLQKQAAVRRTELDEKASELQRLSSERSELLSTALSRGTQRRAEIESRVNTAQEEFRVAELNLKNKKLVSPVDGIVDGLNVHTIGGVSDTGDELLRIVPNAAGLEVEAIFTNEDVGFLRVGQTAKLNMAAFPAERFGFINGKITHVSADAVQQKDEKWGYTIRIALDKSTLSVGGTDYLLQPGMTTTIDVVTGTRPLIGYFFAPIVEAVQSSLGER